MPNTIIFSDFDGTLTNTEGGRVVFSSFYASLFDNPYADYTKGGIKPSDVVQARFKEEDTNDPSFRERILLPEAAQKYLHEVLANDDVELVVVTKNRAEYIQEMLKYQGFTEEEIGKIKIYDANYLKLNGGGKDSAVMDHLSQKQEEVKHVLVFDDSQRDYNDMRAGVKQIIPKVDFEGLNAEAGQFDWNAIAAQVDGILDLPVVKIDTPFDSLKPVEIKQENAPIVEPQKVQWETENLDDDQDLGMSNVVENFKNIYRDRSPETPPPYSPNGIEYLDDSTNTPENKTVKGFLATIVEALKDFKEAVSNKFTAIKEAFSGQKNEKQAPDPVASYLDEPEENDTNSPGSP